MFQHTHTHIHTDNAGNIHYKHGALYIYKLGQQQEVI